MTCFKIKRSSECERLNKGDNVHQLPAWLSLPVAIIFALLFYGVYEAYVSLPKPVTLENEASHPGSFVAERAEVFLKELVALGPRIVGGRTNEVLARDLIHNALNKTASEANPAHKIEIDIQVTSGQYNLGYKPFGLATVYRKMQNVIARVTPAQGKEPDHALLINCHFDSVQAGPGATDDALNCAVMLEALRVITSTNKTFKHALVFLFNGAEENGLQASHGFITQHKWAKNIRAFINLEGAGSGGKEIMFQAGPEHPWLLDHYADFAPHPYAQAIAEELFQSGLIPSDTDFRIFRDFGHIPGVDFAHASNGYVYHTKYDSIDLIKLGTYQHTGDNLVAMLNDLGNAEEIKDTAAHAEGEMVFYDVLGLFMVTYTEITGTILNVFVAACTLITIALLLNSMANDEGLCIGSMSKEFGISILTQVGGWLAALVTSASIACILDMCGRPLSWYSRPWLITGIYVLPTFIVLAFASMALLRFKKRRLTFGHFVQLQMHCLCVMLLFILLALTAASVRSAYLLLVVVLFYELSAAFNLLTGFQNKGQKWLFAHLIFQLPALTFVLYLALTGLGVLVPITGRSGPEHNPDLLIGILSTFLSLVMGGFIVPLICLLRRSVLTIFVGLAIVGAFFIMIATPLGFPYDNSPDMPTPQRYWVFHSTRKLHNEDGTLRANESGVFMLPMDRNSPGFIKSEVPWMKDAIPVGEWCKNELFCGLPFYTSRMHKQSNYSHWVPMESPLIETNDIAKLVLINKTAINDGRTRYHFSIEGPSHMGVFISPYDNVNVVAWDVTEENPNSGPMWGNRPTYFIYYSYGTQKTDLSFTIDVEHPVQMSGAKIDIALTSHLMHLDVHKSKEFSDYLKSFPTWTHVSSWISTIESFKY
ncbi:endoplasmic reticulum metallopeptidase 1-like [Ctenocephalides felis]|uniref:endoplasmic reticulum metallopeptidase 1-like n=1 Tax=Ctenocephalides felis TaxID=7515 RepID=UPI000E6E2767|nr:endoplasmic reticulum metallopeptidase 1-like [Ctenocephalides felis]